MNSRYIIIMAFSLTLTVPILDPALAAENTAKIQQPAKEEKDKLEEITAKEKASEVEALINKAQICDQQNAETYAKVPGETADVAAAAAFDKCTTEWGVATRALIEAQWVSTNAFSEEEKKANPMLVTVTMQHNAGLEKKYGIHAWREAEIKRLRVVIIDARAKQIAR